VVAPHRLRCARMPRRRTDWTRSPAFSLLACIRSLALGTVFCRAPRQALKSCRIRQPTRMAALAAGPLSFPHTSTVSPNRLNRANGGSSRRKQGGRITIHITALGPRLKRGCCRRCENRLACNLTSLRTRGITAGRKRKTRRDSSVPTDAYTARISTPVPRVVIESASHLPWIFRTVIAKNGWRASLARRASHPSADAMVTEGRLFRMFRDLVRQVK
jgi:hypothetical protein